MGKGIGGIRMQVLPGGHHSGIAGDDFIVKADKTGLALGNDDRIETSDYD
jgi:hypothetical protein